MNGFTGSLVHLPFTNFATPQVNFAGFCASNPVFCAADNRGKGSLEGSFPTSPDGKPGDVLGLNTGESYEIRESNTALYGQLDFEERLFGLNFSGNGGVRAVRITAGPALGSAGRSGHCVQVRAGSAVAG